MTSTHDMMSLLFASSLILLRIVPYHTFPPYYIVLNTIPLSALRETNPCTVTSMSVNSDETEEAHMPSWLVEDNDKK
jgi:hypothetical protein